MNIKQEKRDIIGLLKKAYKRAGKMGKYIENNNLDPGFKEINKLDDLSGYIYDAISELRSVSINEE